MADSKTGCCNRQGLEKLPKVGGTTRLGVSGVALLVLETFEAGLAQAEEPEPASRAGTAGRATGHRPIALARDCSSCCELQGATGSSLKIACTFALPPRTTLPLLSFCICAHGTLKRRPSSESVHRVETGVRALGPLRPKCAAPNFGNWRTQNARTP